MLCSRCAHAVFMLCSCCVHAMPMLCSCCVHAVSVLCPCCAHAVSMLCLCCLALRHACTAHRRVSYGLCGFGMGGKLGTPQVESSWARCTCSCLALCPAHLPKLLCTPWKSSGGACKCRLPLPALPVSPPPSAPCSVAELGCEVSSCGLLGHEHSHPQRAQGLFSNRRNCCCLLSKLCSVGNVWRCCCICLFLKRCMCCSLCCQALTVLYTALNKPITALFLVGTARCLFTPVSCMCHMYAHDAIVVTLCCNRRAGTSFQDCNEGCSVKRFQAAWVHHCVPS